MMPAQHTHSALAISVALSLFACDTLEPPQPCYSDAQCPTHMSCVASACVIETVSVSHEFKRLPDQGAPDMDMGMGGTPAEDMTPLDPYPTQSPVCRVELADEVMLERVAEDPNRPTGAVVNLHKVFCFGEVLGVLGRDLTTSAEEQALEDPNLLTLNVLKGEAWEKLTCDVGEFPKVEADGLKAARLTQDGDSEALSLELEYQREGGALTKRAITWGGNCREFDLPPDSRERQSGALTSYVTGAGLSIGSWVQESGEGVIALHNVSTTPPHCRPNFDIFGVEQPLDIWGATLGGQWFSWLSLIPKVGSEDIGEVILMIQGREPSDELDDCEPYRTLRVGTWPLDFKAQKDWRSAIKPHVDPLSKQLWFCNMTEGRVCRLNRWQEGEGLQWLTDQDGQPIKLSLTAEYDVRAGHLVVREQIEYPFPYHTLTIYTPCPERAPQDEGAVDLGACLTRSSSEIKGKIHDYQIILLGDPEEPDQVERPHLLWIEQDDNQWMIKKTKL